MRSKLQLASGIAVAATMFAALTTAGESNALAEEATPIAVQSTIEAPEQTRTVTFVSEPVVQDTGDKTPATQTGIDTADTTEADVPAQSDVSVSTLKELVARQPRLAELSPEMQCLAGAIYFEARGESLDGQLAVGRVIIERANSPRFPNSYCGVVFQRSQFSFVRGSAMPSIKTRSEAWRTAVAMAQIADSGSWDSPVEGALFFHAARVSPSWRLKRIARVDNHVFYR